MRRRLSIAAAPLAGLAAAMLAGAAQPDPPRSSAWLGRLPDGEAKRKSILDCTGCHQFDEKIARPAGVPRTESQWVEAVTRMLGYAGAATSRAGRSPTCGSRRPPGPMFGSTCCPWRRTFPTT